MKNSFYSYLVLIMLIINIGIQTSLQKPNIKKKKNYLKAKILETIPKLANGVKCDTNSHCESGYCGYNGPYLSGSPNDYSEYACMKKHSKDKGEPCWHDNECQQHKSLLHYWSSCMKIYNKDTKTIQYKCK